MTPRAHPGSVRTVIVDGNNVMGAAVAGWWRDPAGAVRRLLDRLRCYAGIAGERVVLVLDMPQPDLAERDEARVTVRFATRQGRDAADDRIRDILDAEGADGVEVVTSDRSLADSARARGAQVVGAGRFLARLDAIGC